MPVKIEIEDAAETERIAERASLVDELYELTTWLETSGANEKAKRVEAIKKTLVEAANTEWNDRSQARPIEGTVARAIIGAASCKREVTDKRGVLTWLKDTLGDETGEETFFEGITVPIGFIDKFLSKTESAPFVTETDGSRTTKVEAL